MLNPGINLDQVSKFFGQHQAISIPEILDDSIAGEIFNALTELEWNLEIKAYGPEPRLRVPLKSLSDPNAPFLNVLDEVPHNIDRDRLFYMRLNVDGNKFQSNTLTGFAEFLNTEDFLGPMRKITGIPDISHCWMEATCYKSCCFLGGHNDDHHPNNRVAFVFNLTRQWQMDWGGLLMLAQHNTQPVIVPPLWNSLAMFRVPRDHFVSTVSPAARGGRYSITGWLRDGPVIDYSEQEGY